MESKQMTLRSQTVQCPHCGEYYSVTYKYCPFCDAGRKAEEKKKAARKQQAASLFTGLFSGKEEDDMDVPIREAGQEQPRQSRSRDHKPAHRSEHRAEPVSTPIPRSENFRKKKTSEMTEEEKRAYRAEREARAAARKRERDRAARAAALVEISGPAEGTLAEDETVPAPEAVSPSGMETVEITIDPMHTAPVAPGVPAEPAGEAEPVQEAESRTDGVMEALQDLALGDPDEQMHAAPVELDGLPVQELSQEVEVEVPTPVPDVTPRPLDPAAVLQGDSELDALLTEIRGLLDEGPVVAPAAPAEAAAPAPEAVSAPAAPAEAPAPEQPSAEPAQTPPAEPVQEIPAEPAAAAPEAPAEAAPAAPELPEEDDLLLLPEIQAVPGGETAPAAEATAMQLEGAELLLTPETAAAAEGAAMRRTEPRARTRQSGARTRQRQKKKNASLPLAPIIAAVIVVVLAAVLVTKVVAPAIARARAADSVSLAQTELVFTEAGKVQPLTVVLEPEDAKDTITWTCSDWNVAGVDSKGNVTARAPGTATVKATNLKGLSASATITCAWGDVALPAAAEGQSEGERTAGAESTAPPEVVAGLSATEITLDGEGKTQQLTLSGVTGAVKWTSSKPGVATVAADGTVTAVSKGSATITAESNGSKYNCNVRCVW